MSLRLKVNLVMLVALGTGVALVGWSLYASTEATARRNVLAQAGIMMGGVDATLQYTNSQVTPLLERGSHVQFLPQSIPFYAAQQVFNRLTATFPDYRFRQPASNPTNPSDKPDASEAAIIARFATHPDLKSLVTERVLPTGNTLSLSEPVRVTDPACLACHSTPGAAPKTMLQVYGSNNGFGWTLGSIVGAEMVSVPEDVVRREARHDLVRTMVALTVTVVVIFVLLNIMLHVFIFVPVRRIVQVADEVSLGNMDLPELDDSSGDEIGSLSRAFNRMRRSLIAAMGLLDQ